MRRAPATRFTGLMEKTSGDPATRATGKPVETWTCRLAGRDYELDVTPGLSTRLMLRVDGTQVYDKAEMDDHRRIRLDGGRVEAWIGARGNLKRATAYAGSVDMDFDAPVGSRAARTQAWGREHPGLFAARHVAMQLGGVLIALLGLGALFKHLIAPVIRWIVERMPDIDWPDIPWPQITWPTLPWPDIHLPRIPWPDVGPPPWWHYVVSFFAWIEPYEDIAKALLIGLTIALFEARRLRRQQRLRRDAEAHKQKQADTSGDGDREPDPGAGPTA